MLVEEMVLDFGSEVVGPAAKMDEALRLASQAPLDAAILDVNVGGAVVFPVADVLQQRGYRSSSRLAMGRACCRHASHTDPRSQSPLIINRSPRRFARYADQPCHTEAA